MRNFYFSWYFRGNKLGEFFLVYKMRYKEFEMKEEEEIGMEVLFQIGMELVEILQIMKQMLGVIKDIVLRGIFLDK